MRKIRKNRSGDGVSEIIANILVLSITVIMFSVIFAWLYTIPPPPASVSVTIKGDVTSDGNFSTTSNVTIILSHEGGEVLLTSEALISIMTQDRGNLFTLAQGGIADGNFNTGDMWVYKTKNNGVVFGSIIAINCGMRLVLFCSPYRIQG